MIDTLVDVSMFFTYTPTKGLIMGMFDYINVEIPLPDNWVSRPTYMQSKSLDCTMNTYTITATGRLVADKIMHEMVPPEERPYPTGKLSFMGCLRERVLEKDVDQDYEGWIHFYGHEQSGALVWHHYSALFVKGQLSCLLCTEEH